MRLGVDASVVDGELVAGDVEVDGGTVVRLGLSPAGSGLVAAPGFVDLQVNGFAGVDLLTTDRTGVREVARALLETGVTAWQPTLISSPEGETVAALRTIADAIGPDDGARVLGVHLEGPFLSPARMGTHPAAHQRDPDRALLERLLDAGPVTYVTLAPELPRALELVDLLVARGVTVAAGHTDATAADAHAAFDRGVRTTTHLFNAMRPFAPRDPGIAGAALSRSDVVVQVIADRHHLAEETLGLVWRAASGRCALVTDAIAAAGIGDGIARLGGVEVEVRGSASRRADGTLAGSVLTMPEAVANLVGQGVSLPAAIDAATTVPARVVGREDVGRIGVGARADLVVLDESIRVRRVLVAGRTLVDA